MKTCLSHCETSATRQSLRKLRRERIRKAEPQQVLRPSHCRSAASMKTCLSHCEGQPPRFVRKLRRERIRKGRSPAGFASKPLQECNLKNLETLIGTPKNNEIVPHKNNENVPQPLRNVSHQAKPKKAASGAHPKRQSPSRFCAQAIAGVQPQKSRNVAFGTPKNNEIVPQPLRNFSHQAKPKKAASGAHPKRQSPSRFCVQAIAELQPQKSRNVAFGTPKNNEIVPQPLRNFSHQAKPKKAASGAHPKRQSPSRFCVQAIAELQPQKSRNVAFGTPIKTMKTCPSHCETAATRQSPRKLERIRKGRAPAGFASKPLQECSLKNLETLRLEPLKTMKSCPSHCETSTTRQSLRKLRRERIRKGRAPAGFASKPLRNCNHKNLETLLLEPLKTMKSCPSRCETVPKPCETATTNNAETLPTKRMKSWMSFQNLWRTARKCQTSKTSVQSLWRTARETAEQQQDSCPNHAKQRPRTMPKYCLRKSASHQAKPKQKVLGSAETCLTLLSEALKKQAPKPRTNATRHHQVAGSVRTHLAS